MKLDDSVIAHVAKLIQLAILTGTDIVDHLRTFEVEDEDGLLKLTKNSKERIEEEIKEMADRIENERGANAQKNSE